MFKYHLSADTICALATPAGHGGIGVIRVSGPKSVEIVKKISNLPEKLTSHHVYFSIIQDTQKEKKIDEAVVTYFEEGRSYTGEETIEISCHGSPAVVEEVIQNLILAGSRHAEKGEFTFRSFMNGRMDLIQAEGVLTLIESETKKAAEVALRQIRGELSHRIQEMKNQTLNLLAHLEADIDFSMEGLETISRSKAKQEVFALQHKTQSLMNTYSEGRLLTENFTISFIGEPNVGKSSLFNAFLKDDRAIVTEIAGTTRDTIEGFSILSGIRIRYVDTAGLRDTNDIIESLGIQRTREQILKSDLIFYVLDSTKGKIEIDPEIYKQAKDKIIFIGNKSDLAKKTKSEFIKELEDFRRPAFFVSAKVKTSLQEVISYVESQLKKEFHETSAFVLKTRQFETLQKTKACFDRAMDLCTQEASPEFLAFELRDGLEGIMELLGEKYDDQVLEKVFQEFCIGK